MACRPPMPSRLELLVVEDASAQKTGFLLLLFLSVVPIDLSVPFYTWALSLEVLGPAALLVFLLYLVMLDCYNWAHQQVSEAASRRGLPDLQISVDLGFSSKGLEHTFHRWLLKVPAQKVHPWLGLVAQLAMHYQIAQNVEDGCGWAHQLVGMPGTVLLAAGLALHSRAGPRGVSLLNLAAIVATLTTVVVMVYSGDSCMCSLQRQSSSMAMLIPKTVGFFVVGLVVFPVLMEHHGLASGLSLVGTILVETKPFINMPRNLALWSVSDQWAVLTICLASVLTFQMSFIFRYCLSAVNRQSFLSSLPYAGERVRQ
mmetsp:Transcript_35052/g.99362  ORF Transcript_35052/g.99362 Transcript_35052/m.99362 type:complete len:314 (-) Transcript_35052:191-1132(-)